MLDIDRYLSIDIYRYLSDMDNMSIEFYRYYIQIAHCTLMATMSFQDDREVVLAATSVRGSSLVHASQRLRQERAVVLSAVSGGP